MARKIAQTKSDYIRLVCIYKAKREAVKEKYPIRSPNYSTAVKRINMKLKIYRNAIYRISGFEKRLHYINDRVKYKYGKSMYLMNTNWSLKAKFKSVLWKMFCKYAIEQGIPNFHISNYMGWSKRKAAFYRLQFSREMKHNIDYLNQWQAFKKGMERDFKKLKTA